MSVASVIRLLTATACVCLSSCGSLQEFQALRPETELSNRERLHLAALLEEMAAGWDGMQRGRITDRRKAQDRYDRALAAFLHDWDEDQSPRYWQSGAVFAGRRQSFVIEFDGKADPHREVSPSQIDQIIFPSRVKPRGTDTLSARPGVGIPVVGHILRTKRSRREQPFLPPNGGNLTLTAMMDLGKPAADSAGAPRRCRLRLHNALNVETVKVNGDERLLAANFTAAKHLALSKKSLRLFAWLGLLYPERTLADCQLYRMDVYDPRRIPVVFVHGLMSDPHIWLNAVNAISSDPELRAAYQPLYFLYPTALGIPQSSARLRDSLLAMREHFDPDHDDPGLKRMVLVGHSMGGLLSRMQVIDPGDKLWNCVFSRPPEELDVSDALRGKLVHALKFKPVHDVKRLVFIATPHRGSDIAGKKIVRRLSSLIRLPVDTALLMKQFVTGNLDALSPQIRDWGFYGFLSLGTLSTRHPCLEGLNGMPIPVKHYSIIGDRGKNNGVLGSDGAVPYVSAHLDSAASEKIVPYWHGCVERPEVVQEIMRILKQHLRESGRASR
jgi:pimeloyl-ACP methyl ester carboxylesterase